MLIELSIIYSMFHNLAVFLLLFEYRCSRRVFIAATAAGISVMAAVEIWIISHYGLATAGATGLLVCSLPSFLLFFAMAKDRGARFVFTFCLADTASMWVLLFSGLLDYFAGGGGVVAFLLRLAAYPVLEWAIWRWFRRPYLEAVRTVEHGWWLFAAITIVCYLILALGSSYPTLLQERPDDIPLLTLFTILLPLAYGTIFVVLRQQQSDHLTKERQGLLQAQAVMMERRAAEMRRCEERMRIERHDLRHRLETLAVLVKKEQHEKALDYLDSSKAALNEAVPRRYCRNAVLDAILSLYFERAGEQGVRVDTRLDIPDELPVDAAELSTVFANALENALRACARLPREERRIVCTCVSEPRFLFEIANPCREEVRFGPDGLPLAERDGHGIGTRSIMAFAEKHSAVCRFRVEDGWFKFQLTL